MNEQYLIETCKMGLGEETCAFIVMGSGGFQCAKDDAVLRNTINLQLAEGSMTAKGDNCKGYQQEMGDG